jgi:hypothetical protein
MPSKSKKQHNLMEAVAHSPAFAAKVGIPQSVGKDFAAADKGKKFKGGGMMDKKDMMQDKKMVKKAVKMHDDQLHGGKKTDLASLKKGGCVKMAKGGTASARADGCAVKGKTKGTMVAMCGGGMYKKGK